MKIEKNNETKSTFIINNKTFFIPSEWNLIKLSDITTVKDGTHDSPKYVQNGIPFITSKNLKNNKIDFMDVKYISKEDHEKFYKRSDVSMGDLLFGMIGTIGNPTIVDTDITFSIKNVALIKKNNNYCQKFLKYQMLSSNIITNQLNSLKNGGVLSFIKLSDIRNLMIIDIKLEKQKKISYILSLQEEHIENIKDLIKKIEIRNQYYAEKIFSGELLVKKNENGLLDIYENTKWENATINNLIKKVPFEFKISKIKDKFKEFPKSKIKAGDAKNINNGKYPFFNCSDKQSLFFNEYIINDEVLYLSTGGKPAIHYFNGKASYSTDVWAIAFDKDIINKYAYYYIKHNIKTLNHCFNGAALKHLNKNDFRNIDIIYPNHNEQILIINLLDNLESEISSLQKILEKEQLRFQWLLDNLLSGEYQVVDE